METDMPSTPPLSSAKKKPQDPWRGKNEEILEGFEWHSGVVVSRGLWIWSKPFILKGKSEKEVAVFLLDTEGTMDVAGDKENGVKISTLSMLFSSYLILNVNEKLREPDLEYLEMTLDLMKDAFPEDVQNLHLDLMMRDWHNWHECSEEHGKKYLKDTVKKWILNSKLVF
ncbi:RING finger protein 112-like [Ornithorhynchus anatinus]|uniref:RING finger protein 112-like n=1 Tax=Ornithorhynchus anatinus TaxID=9258 RepID=UPI0019D46037|nr:RING finger protein 112-like [Ornithorhynchus anatinus]XP_039767148.1 RING finger protein 112-like [Ornithorhynchus anatinus]XP_039767149.1 RING finger protein 112-like [Ornithorhynchus anatinus]XP_039767150.1 RING finger protein 112-like [Ornithorhynchus anatinus]